MSEARGTLAVLVGGGPAPGINSVISATTIEAINEGFDVVGVQDGFKWLVRRDASKIRPLAITDVSRIHLSGGSFLGTARENPTKSAENLNAVVETLLGHGVSHLVTFRQEDLFKADFREATVVTLYLLPDLNVKLRPRLWDELKPGTRIVSHQFEMGTWKPEKKLESNGRTVYFWTVPPKDKQPKL